MNDIASTSLVTVRRPPTMLPYAFKQSLEDLARAGRVRVEHVAGDQAVVEPLEASDVPIAIVERVEVPHGAVRDESRAVIGDDQASTPAVAATAAEKTSEDGTSAVDGTSNVARVGFPESTGAPDDSRPAEAPQESGPPKGVTASRAGKRAKKDHGFRATSSCATFPVDAQAGARLIHARKVRSPGPRTRKRRVVMRAPREGSKHLGGATSVPLPFGRSAP